eukprot:scaffold1896_cov331-Prasinococcus_capsulatus_cf.AAC.4
MGYASARTNVPIAVFRFALQVTRERSHAHEVTTRRQGGILGRRRAAHSTALEPLAAMPGPLKPSTRPRRHASRHVNDRGSGARG